MRGAHIVLEEKRKEMYLLHLAKRVANNQTTIDKTDSPPAKQEEAKDASKKNSDKEHIVQRTARKLGSTTSKLRMEVKVRDVYKMGPGNLIGGGRYSKVYAGRDCSTREKFAIKVIKIVSGGKNRKVAISREIDLLSKMQHDNVLYLKEYFVEENEVYLVTEWLAGKELTETIRERSYTEADARIIFTQLLKGVKYLHEMGIVHRDLKISNLLFARKNDISSLKIIDFGYAKQDLQPCTPRCTPAFAAPEVLRNCFSTYDLPYTKAVDLWSAGVVLYILLGGRFPFEGCPDKSINTVYQDAFDGRFSFDDPVWELISDGAKDMISGLLTTNPEIRMTAAEALNHPWIKSTGRAKGRRLPPLTICQKRKLYSSPHPSLDSPSALEGLWGL